MSYETKLANAKLELQKLEDDYKTSYAKGVYNYEARRNFDNAARKLRGKISRLESKVIATKGPIIHLDMFGQPFLPGSQVVWSDSGRYAGFVKTWYVSYCTPKQVSLVRDINRVGQPGTSTAPEYLLVVDKLVNPVVIPPVKEPDSFTIWGDADFEGNEDLEELLRDYWDYYAADPDDRIKVKVQAWIEAGTKCYETWYDEDKQEVVWEELPNENGP